MEATSVFSMCRRDGNRVLTVDILTLMVLSPEADTMYLSSSPTTLTAARWPTRTRRRVMSVAEAMSHGDGAVLGAGHHQPVAEAQSGAQPRCGGLTCSKLRVFIPDSKAEQKEHNA